MVSRRGEEDRARRGGLKRGAYPRLPGKTKRTRRSLLRPEIKSNKRTRVRARPLGAVERESYPAISAPRDKRAIKFA